MDNLPDIVKAERAVLEKTTNIRGVLMRLPKLIEALSYSTQSQDFIDDNEEILEIRIHDNRKIKKNACLWFEDRLGELEQSNYINNPLIKKKLSEARKLIRNGKYEKQYDINFNWGYFDYAFDRLSVLANAIAEFGDEAVFKGFATDRKETQLDFRYLQIPLLSPPVFPKFFVKSGNLTLSTIFPSNEDLLSEGAEVSSVISYEREEQNFLERLRISPFPELSKIQKNRLHYARIEFRCFVNCTTFVSHRLLPTGSSGIDNRNYSQFLNLFNTSIVIMKNKRKVKKKITGKLLQGKIHLGTSIDNIAKQLGHGISHLEVKWSCEDIMYYYLLKGCIYFQLPDYVKKMMRSEDSTYQGQREEMSHGDASILWKLIKDWAELSSFKPDLQPGEKIETWEDLEKFNLQRRKCNLLRSFASSDISQYFFNREQLLEIIDRFLAMVSAHIAEVSMIKGPARKRYLYSKAKDFAINNIIKKVYQLDEEKRPAFTSIRAHQFLKELAKRQNKSEEFIQAISLTMVREDAAPEAEKCLSERGIEWKRSGGRPKKSKTTKKTKPFVQSKKK